MVHLHSCRKDDEWRLSCSVYVFITIGLLLLLCAISAVIVIVQPWTVSWILFIVLLLPLRMVEEKFNKGGGTAG